MGFGRRLTLPVSATLLLLECVLVVGAFMIIVQRYYA
jgi:hypothetical protein